ncbi:MAG: VCBS repeat-containing protein [Deltaproteobacteria bacterium]|nr:VCBS repeat-containing protein [Deltaproteobacteria bacterium]
MSLWFTWIGLAVAVEPNAPQDVEAAWGVPRDTPAWAALALDLDGDGLIELATVTHAPMYYGRMGADQRFTAAQDSPWGEQTADRHGMTACDVDRDGDFELIVASGGARGRGGNPAGALGAYRRQVGEPRPRPLWGDRRRPNARRVLCRPRRRRRR